MLLGMQVCIIKIIHYCLGCYFGDQHGGGGGGGRKCFGNGVKDQMKSQNDW